MEKVVKRKKPKPTIIDKAKYLQYCVREKLMLKNGKIRKFDNEFYKMIDGKYINGVPAYYFMTPMWTMRKCFDASAKLASILPDSCYVCRGHLSSLNYASKIDDAGNEFVHGWVEMDGYVYDTTWKYIMKKEDYYSLFKTKDVTKTIKKEFFEGIKEIGTFNTNGKEWWENNYVPFASLFIDLVRTTAKTTLKLSNISEEERTLNERLLNDLPSEESQIRLFAQFKEDCRNLLRKENSKNISSI